MSIRPIVKYHGGKGRLFRWIVGLLPDHAVYGEPFGGACSVLLNKPRCQREVYGDLDPDMVNLLSVVRDQGDEFVSRIRSIEYKREVYQEYRTNFLGASFGDLSPLERAVTSYVTRRMSRGGLCGTFCWSSRVYSGGPAEVHCWNTSHDNIRLISERLQGVEIRYGLALDLIEDLDGEGTLLYLDPPYLGSTRQSTDLYRYEMPGEKDHAELCSRIRSLKSKVVLSGYPSPLYDEWLPGWRRMEMDVANHSSHAREVKERKKECVYLNF